MKEKNTNKIKHKENHIKRIVDLEDKIKELENGWQRCQADFDNFQKRTIEQRQEEILLNKLNFFASITPVLDNFYRAMENPPSGGAPKDIEWLEGIKQIEKQLEDILTSEGLEKIPASPSTKFDPIFHEAISSEPNEKINADHIISEVESGWKYGSRVIKPAKVRVSRGNS